MSKSGEDALGQLGKNREYPEAETPEQKARAKAMAHNIDRVAQEIQRGFQPDELIKRVAYRAMVNSFRGELKKAIQVLDPAFTRKQLTTFTRRLIWVLEEDETWQSK